ncbi:hypothetical protein Trydic_g20915 [Trypoxylus dichotomus]
MIRFGISETEECNYCNRIDTVGDIFFERPTWTTERQQTEGTIRHVILTTTVANMLENEENWKVVETMAPKIMGKKKSHERSSRRANMQSKLGTEELRDL